MTWGVRITKADGILWWLLKTSRCRHEVLVVAHRMEATGSLDLLDMEAT